MFHDYISTHGCILKTKWYAYYDVRDSFPAIAWLDGHFITTVILKNDYKSYCNSYSGEYSRILARLYFLILRNFWSFWNVSQQKKHYNSI